MLELGDLNNITPPRVPLTDPRTGYIAREWYLFFLSQFSQSRALTEQSNSNQIGISSTDQSLQATQAALASTQNVVDELSLAIDGVTLSPAPLTPHTPRRRYGAFYDTTTQTAAAINTAYGITFNAADLSVGVTRGTPTSRIYVDTPNVYDIQFSAQIDKTSGGVGLLWIWLRKNGVDVANSASQVRIQGNDAELVAAWNFLLDLNAGDYFELMWAVDTTDVQIAAFAAAAFRPAIPSVILTVTDNISV